MSDFVTSLVRDIVQKLFGVVFAYFAVHGFNVPSATKDSVDNWAVLGVTAGLLWLWTAITRALEERKGSSKFDQMCRVIGRFFMLGVGSTPTYPAPPVVDTPADVPVDETAMATGSGMGG